MKESRQQIQKILDIIENEESSDPQGGLTMEQIKAILLGSSSTIIPASRAPSLLDHISVLKKNAELNFYLPLPEETSLRMKLANFIKRVIRKLIRPFLLPLVDQQNRFNAGVLHCMYEIYDQNQTLITEHNALRQLLIAVGKELKESRENADE